MSPVLRRRALAAARLLAALVGLALAARSLGLSLRFSTPVPYSDQWEVVADLMRIHDGSYALSDLFAQHNEHRIATARLSFFLDAWLCHLGNLSVILTGYVLYAALAAVLALAATRGRPLRTKLVAFALALAGLWSVAGWINLGWAFQLQWAYVHLLPVLAMLFFLRAGLVPGRRAWAWLAAAILMDGGAVFSMSSGLVTILPILLIALWTRARLRHVGLVLLAHALFVGLFLWGYDTPPQGLALSPVALLRYLAPYLGTAFPASRAFEVAVGAVGLAVGVGIAALATVRALRHGRRLGPAIALLLGTVSFVLAEGLATAVGRGDMPDPVGLALRYGTPSMLFWTALGLAVWRWCDRTGRRRLALGVAAAGVVAALASNTLGNSVGKWRQWSATNDAAGLDFVSGATAGEAARMVYPWPDRIQDRIAFLRDQGLGPFAPEAWRFRAPINSLGGREPGALAPCAGTVDQVRHEADGTLHVQGWAVRAGAQALMTDVLVFDGVGRLLGYNRPWQPREDPRRLAGRAVVPGYDLRVRLPEGDGPSGFSLVALFGGRAAPCRIALPEAKAEDSAG